MRSRWYWAGAVSFVASQGIGLPSVANAFEPAELRQIAGTIYVERVDGYWPAVAGMRVFAGQRVLVPSGASAMLVLPSGCVFRLQTNSMIRVRHAATCNESVVAMSGVLLAQAIGLEDADTITDTSRSSFGAIGSDGFEPEPELEPFPRATRQLEPVTDSKPSVLGGDSEVTEATPEPALDDVEDSPARVARVEETEPVFGSPEAISVRSGGVFAGAGMTVAAVGGGLALAVLAASGAGAANAPSAPGAPFSNLSPE